MAEQPNLFSDFPLREPKPWKVVFPGIEYSGEIIVTDRWEERLVEELGKDVHFRIVVFTKYQRIPPQAIQDRRIAICVPAAPIERVKEKREAYRTRKEQVDKPLAKEKERLLREQALLYGAGSIHTRGGLAIDTREVFSAASNEERFSLIASALLADVYVTSPYGESQWNTALPFARLIEENLRASTDPDEIEGQKGLLLEKLAELEEGVKGVKGSLEILSAGLGMPPEEAVLDGLGRLSRIAQSKGHLDFYAAAQDEYSAPPALEEDISLYRRMCQLENFTPEM